MANFDAPSFSLGLDFDADSEPQLPAEDHLEPILAPNPSASFNIIEENADEFESEQVMDSDPDTRPDPPRVLKRLRRAADESSATKKESEKTLVWDNGDDDIEEFSSSQEKNDVDSSTQYHSICSSSKIPLKRLGLVTTQSSSQLSSRKAGQASVASASASLEASHDGLTFPNSCVQTPAFDEVCKEYFQSLNHKSASQKLGSRKADLSSQELGSQKTEQLQDLDDPLPPAHRYFFHADPRIQNLVRSRLPFFSPLSMADNGGHQQPTVSIMDFKNQFNKGESSKQRGSRKGSGKNCSTSRSSKSKKPNAENGAFEGWVNPKTSAAVPKNAGKRRVHASGQPAGHWYTSPEGRKVYITRTGQELSGHMAYRHYRKLLFSLRPAYFWLVHLMAVSYSIPEHWFMLEGGDQNPRKAREKTATEIHSLQCRKRSRLKRFPVHANPVHPRPGFRYQCILMYASRGIHELAATYHPFLFKFGVQRPL
ncbi:hypothetical protein GOBAR_AA25228 [Gossypium barbadense]|uniref:Uncharacterized protein n=1 Tax=Gossypium barbadense TaxID=3634 RepID=A0A2P5WWI7_GOSBA|nr:hypothetical protein GOBAR_AA25228 [Gossypium barbadense]